MTIRPETTEFIAELEDHSGRKMSYPTEVARLLDGARRSNVLNEFEDLIFQAKFSTRTFGIMKRIGADGEGYGKLTAEFRSSVERASTLLKELVKGYPEEDGQQFHATFLAIDQDSLSKLMDLMQDLTLVKNWIVDGNPLP
jgi:hypothetical protein